MDYEFLRDVTGQVIVKFSMGHEAIGHEFTLLIDAEEVIVRANGMSVAFDALEEGLSYYNEESLSLCGSDDFLLML